MTAGDVAEAVIALYDIINLNVPDPSGGSYLAGFLTAISSLDGAAKAALFETQLEAPKHFEALCANAAVVLARADVEGDSAEDALHEVKSLFRNYVAADFTVVGGVPDYGSVATAIRNYFLAAAALGERASAYEELAQILALDADMPQRLLNAQSANFFTCHYFYRARQAIGRMDSATAHQQLELVRHVSEIIAQSGDVRAQRDAQSALDFAARLELAAQWMED